MRILVIFTGGTIGCLAGEVMELTRDEPEGRSLLIETYLSRHSDDETYFDVLRPINTLSENMTVPKWNELITSLQDVNFSAYGGIVIAHGTDTMAYTASLLGILLKGITIPVVLVGSNHPLPHPAADGHQNFTDAVRFIQTTGLPGVYVISFGRMYLGTKIRQCRHFDDRYDAPGGIPFGRMEEGKFSASETGGYPSSRKIRETAGDEMLLHRARQLTGNILLLKPYVGLRYDLISLENNLQAVLHGTYHSFTVCADEDDPKYSFLSFAKRCKDAGKALYLTPFSSALLSGEKARYSSTDRLLQAGIKMVCDVTLESAYAKLLLALSLYDDEDEREMFLEKTVFFEKI